MSDNSTTVACIRKQGSARSYQCNKMARHIWTFIAERDCWITCEYIAGKLNVEADHASRVFDDTTEWTFTERAWSKIRETIEFEPKIDLFASRLNAKCKRYVAWQPDPKAIAVDAFSIKWQNDGMYAFPPFAIITQVIEKMLADDARLLLVVPYWPSQPWFPMFVDSIEHDVYSIGMTSDLLHLPFRSRTSTHPKASDTSLTLAICSARSWRANTSSPASSTPSWRPGQIRPGHSTPRCTVGGSHIARNGDLIPVKAMW